MRWRTVGLCVLSLVGMVGCPDTFGKDGALDEAAHRDAVERVRQSGDCTEKEWRQFCEGQEDSEACRKECGG